MPKSDLNRILSICPDDADDADVDDVDEDDEEEAEEDVDEEDVDEEDSEEVELSVVVPSSKQPAIMVVVPMNPSMFPITLERFMARF